MFDRIYSIELEMNDSADTAISALYLDLHLEIDSDLRIFQNFGILSWFPWLMFLITRNLLNQCFLVVMLKYYFEGFMVTTMIWFTSLWYLYHKWPQICSVCHNPALSSCMTYRRVCDKSNTAGIKHGSGTVYPFRAPSLPRFVVIHFSVAQSLISCAVFCNSLK